MSRQTTYAITKKKLVIRSVKEFSDVDSFYQIVRVSEILITNDRRKLLQQMEGYGYRVWVKLKGSK